MKKTFLALVVFVCVSALIAAGCAAPAPAPAPVPAPAPAPKPAPAATKLRLTSGHPVTNHTTKVVQLFKQEVEAATKGVVTVELYLGGELFRHADVPRVLPVGGVEMALSHGGHWGGISPIFDATQHPFAATVEALAKGRDTWLPLLDREFNKANVKVLAPLESGEGNLSSRVKMIKSPADFAGQKLRGPTDAHLKMIQRFGGIPITLAAEEVQDAIGKGAIDGAWIAWTTAGPRAYYEVAKYHSGDTGTQIWYLLMNLDTWKELDANTQKIVTAAALKSEKASQTLGREDDEKWKKVIVEKGATIHMLTPQEVVQFQNASKPVYDEWVERTKKAGVGEQAVAIMKSIGLPGY